MRGRVGGMVWFDRREVDQRLLEHFRRELRIIPRKLANFGPDDVKPDPINCYAETQHEFGVPRSWWFKTSRHDHELDWSGVSFGEHVEVRCLVEHTGIYEEQETAIQAIMDHYDPVFESLEYDRDELPDKTVGLAMGAILQAQTGFGKTDTALSLWTRMHTTAIVLVHKEFLLKQWLGRIAKWCPGAHVGIVQEKRCEFENKDIVIAMAQSLALDDGTRYPLDLYDWPGMVICDETHRIGAPTWSPIPQRFPAAYRLGLTATPRRRDGCDKVFWWHIGDVEYVAKTEMPKPHVRMVVVDKGYPDVIRKPDANPTIVVNIIGKLTRRNNRILVEVLKALKAPAQRKVMVLSHRLDHLRELERELRSALKRSDIEGVTTGFYVGEWFTGDVTHKLAKGSWPMEDGGREKAILTIYQSLSRRKGWQGHIREKSCDECPGVGECQEPKEAMGCKVHVIRFSGQQLNAIFGNGSGDRDHYFDDAEEWWVLEDFTDIELYEVAKQFKIHQKKTERKKPRTDEELHEAERARVIFATYQMCSEGIDLPAVDTIVLATPSSDVEQAVGRGRRFCKPVRFGGRKRPDDCEHFCPWRAESCEGKPNLVVADIVDLIPLGTKRENWRRGWYADCGFKVAEGG